MWACPCRTQQQETSQLLPSRTFHRGENQATPDPSVLAQDIRCFPVFEPTLSGTSLVLQGIRIHLRTQETRVRFLVWEDSTCLRAAKPRTPEPSGPRTCAHQQEKPPHETPTPCSEEQPCSPQLEKSPQEKSSEEPAQPPHQNLTAACASEGGFQNHYVGK